MGIKPGWTYEREWEWTVGNGGDWDWKRHSCSSLIFSRWRKRVEKEMIGRPVTGNSRGRRQQPETNDDRRLIDRMMERAIGVIMTRQIGHVKQVIHQSSVVNLKAALGVISQITSEYCCPVWARSNYTNLVTDTQLHSSMRLISGCLCPTQVWYDLMYVVKWQLITCFKSSKPTEACA